MNLSRLLNYLIEAMGELGGSYADTGGSLASWLCANEGLLDESAKQMSDILQTRAITVYLGGVDETPQQ